MAQRMEYKDMNVYDFTVKDNKGRKRCEVYELNNWDDVVKRLERMG